MENDQLSGNMNQAGSNASINENENNSFIGINVPLLSNANETFRQIKEKRFSMIKPWSDFFDKVHKQNKARKKIIDFSFF